MKQLDHRETFNESLNGELIVVAENIRTPENVGMMFRVGEAFGVEEFYFCGNTPDLTNKKVKKTSRSTEHQVKSHFACQTDDIISRLKADGFAILALEITSKSKNISRYQTGEKRKIALFVGSERDGLSSATLSKMDEAVYIPMMGKNSSINVVNALSIGLYELSKQINQIHKYINTL